MDCGFLERIAKMNKESISGEALLLNQENIAWMVEALGSREDHVRYPAFLLLRERSLLREDVYPYWDIFVKKLYSENSYQRSIGLILIAENTKWDIDNKINNVIIRYLELCDDEKPVTVRQCIQSLAYIVPYKAHLFGLIADTLLSIDIMKRKDTQRKVLRRDIVTILMEMQKCAPQKEIEEYIKLARTGMDMKTIKEIFGNG